MEVCNDISKGKNKDIIINKYNAKIKNIKSNYILLRIYGYLNKRKSLIIVKYNKKIQKRMNLSIKDFQEYSEIEIEVILCKNSYGQFININEKDKLFYHIYFNDNKKEIKNKYEINKKDKVTIIKIIIDYQVRSLRGLFYWCKCIDSIDFKKFYRDNIDDMSWIFFECSSLKK